MYKMFLLLGFCLSHCLGFSFEKLHPKYCISYGDPSAEVHVTEYFSFSCLKCIDLFNQDFSEIKRKYIDTKTKNKLKAQYKTLNPFDLRIQIERKLKKIFAVKRPKTSPFDRPLQ